MMAIVSINHLQPPFNNVLMRRALQAAVGQEDVMAGMGLPENMYVPRCLSIYMCDSPGTTDAGTAVLSIIRHRTCQSLAEGSRLSQ